MINTPPQEDTVILNVYALNKIVSKYRKQKLIKLRVKSTNIFGDFNIP